MVLFSETLDILGLARGKEWSDLKKGITNDQVRQVYELMATLWPPDTNLTSLLPEPSPTLRALYLGDIRPESLISNVGRFGLYADELFVINPFINPWTIHPEMNPIDHPQLWRADTLKLAFFSAFILPWVQAGVVWVIPDPGDFDRNLRVRTWDLAQERLKDFEGFEEEITADAEVFASEELERTLSRTPPEAIREDLRSRLPHLTDQEIGDFLEYLERRRTRDPLLLEQPLEEKGEMILSRAGVNLEMGLYLAHLIGAFPYTNLRARWKELLMLRQELPEPARVWTPLTRAFQDLDFEFLDRVDPQFATSLRADGRLESFRGFLRRIWKAAGAEDQATRMEEFARDFRDELHDEYRKAQGEWDQIRATLVRERAAIASGLLISGKFVPEVFFPALGLATVTELLHKRYKRRSFARRMPMSVFIDLSKRNP